MGLVVEEVGVVEPGGGGGGGGGGGRDEWREKHEGKYPNG